MPSDDSADDLSSAPAGDARQIFQRVSIPVAYKVGYVSNSFREPSFRTIETDYGLSRPETLVLIFLGEIDGATASEICENSGHLKNNISRAVTGLESKGLIRRLASADDQRRQHLHLTRRGRDLLRKFMPRLQQREVAMMKSLTQAEYAIFNELLGKVCAAVPQWRDERF